MKESSYNSLINQSDLKLTLAVMMIFIVVFLYLFQISYNQNYANENTTVFSVKAVDVLKNQKLQKQVRVPQTLPVDTSFDYFIDISKYKYIENQSIATHFALSDVRVYVDNKLIYEIKHPDSNYILKSGAAQSVIFDLPEKIINPYVKIHITPRLESLDNFKLAEILIGNKADIIVTQLKNDAFTIVISVILILSFIVSLLANLKQQMSLKGEYYSVFNLSVLGFIVAIYYLSQLWSVSYFFSNVKEFIYCLKYISVVLTFIPLNLFIKYKVDPKFRKGFDAINLAIIVNVLVQLVLTLVKFKELKEMLWMSHILMCLAMCLIFISIIRTNSKKYPSKKTLYIPAVLISIPALALIYYIIFETIVIKNITLIVVITLIGISVKELYENYLYFRRKELELEETEKTRYKKLAVTDTLTGLSNRQAYEEFTQDVERNNLLGWVVSIDINHLKYVNDNFGHLKGDKLITDFADVLKSLEEKQPNIQAFRMGGDEFLLFIDADRDSDIKKLIHTLKAQCTELKRFSKDFIPSFSAGYHYHNPAITKSIKETYHIADQMMYQDKFNSKQRLEC